MAAVAEEALREAERIIALMDLAVMAGEKVDPTCIEILADALGKLMQEREVAEGLVVAIKLAMHGWQKQAENAAAAHSLALGELACVRAALDVMEDAAQATTVTLAKVMRERNEARRFGENTARQYNELLADKQRDLRCAFCNALYPPGTAPTQDEALSAHISVCEAHPMREVERKLDVAVEALHFYAHGGCYDPDDFDDVPTDGPVPLHVRGALARGALDSIRGKAGT